MRITYQLKINTKNTIQYNAVSNILNIHSDDNDGIHWSIWRVEEDDDEWVDYLHYFMSLLEGKYTLLNNIGIERDDITIWYHYQYDQQCSIVFNSNILLELGNNGITLCISCWQG